MNFVKFSPTQRKDIMPAPSGEDRALIPQIHSPTRRNTRSFSTTQRHREMRALCKPAGTLTGASASQLQANTVFVSAATSTGFDDQEGRCSTGGLPRGGGQALDQFRLVQIGLAVGIPPHAAGCGHRAGPSWMNGQTDGQKKGWTDRHKTGARKHQLPASFHNKWTWPESIRKPHTQQGPGLGTQRKLTKKTHFI